MGGWESGSSLTVRRCEVEPTDSHPGKIPSTKRKSKKTTGYRIVEEESERAAVMVRPGLNGVSATLAVALIARVSHARAGPVFLPRF